MEAIDDHLNRSTLFHPKTTYKFECLHSYKDGSAICVQGTRELADVEYHRMLRTIYGSKPGEVLALPLGYWTTHLSPELAKEARRQIKAEMDDMLSSHSWFV